MLIKGSFKQQNILWEVYFKSELYPEVSLEIGSSPDGLFSDSSNFQVYFSADAVEVTTESPEDTFQPIIKHSATVNLLTKTYIGQYFWSESPLDIRVEIFRNKEIIFSGFVTQGSYSQSYSDIYDELNISCVDYLSVLEFYNYADISHNYDTYKTSASNVSFQKIFNNLLIDGLDFHLAQKSSLYYDQSKDSILLKNTIFDDIEFSELNFLGDDEDSVDTKEDVLSKILTYLNLHIIQLGKDYLIFDWDFINNVSEGLSSYIDLWDRSKTFTKKLLTSPDYPELIKRFHYSSSSTNLSIADVYNKIQVNCSLESTDDAIVSPFDDEVTTKIYPKKYLYQTEVLSPGKGFNAAYYFLDYVKNNRKELNDDFTIIDYYIQQISNPSWTLYGGHDVQKDYTVVHQDILKYVPYNSKGEPYKAYFIPSEFPERFGVTALYSIGCIQKKQADINKDMSAVSPNSLQMSPYIVISVNGNGDDSENGHYPKDQDLIDAIPIAEYTGNISGGVYSPSDDDTTNYMVFSGKLMFVPRTWSELTFVWDMVKQFDNFISLTGFTVPYYKDEGKTFRTNKFYTVDNPVSIQDQSKFDGSARDFTDKRRSPYLDLSFANSQDKVKWFQYNYTRLENGDASSIDNIKKLSVFECQLVVGDKTFVETVNSDGSSTYSWETYNPALDLTENQQSFTLGIDPNKGDYILGQEFELENNITFDMNLGSNKGFAIPIKKSDNLKGNIVFKILGPFQLQWNDITRRHKTMIRHTKYTDHDKYILANCSSIVIKDFNCKLISDNSGLEVNNEKDLIYVSTEDKKFTNSYETDFDITSGLSSQECYEKQINNKVYMNYPVTTTGEVVTKIVNKNYQVKAEKEGDPVFLQDKPEKFYIDQYFREYSKPRIIFQVPVREKLFTNKPMIDLFGSFVCFQTFKDRSFKLIGIDYSSDDETPRNLTFKELPEEFGKPADDYDWTDNSETGGEVEIDKGGPNESIECDPAKIADYFTITNTGSGKYYLIITINSSAKKKHFYYTTDDRKWVKSTDNLEINLGHNDKIRLRCIFNGNTEEANSEKPYLTFSSNDQLDVYSGINVSGDIQSLSAGDDFKNYNNLATYCNGIFRGKSWTFNGIKLSSQNLTERCYEAMFKQSGITSLQNVILPATVLKTRCYNQMFQLCSGLINVNEELLPATTLTEGCYEYMFDGCNNLLNTPKLPATIIPENAYYYMFNNCINLNKILIPNIIKNVSYQGCAYMFNNCQKITDIPCVKIFSQNLQLSENCYFGMFQQCTGVKSVTIYTTNITGDSCFGQLFNQCSNLNEINYYGNVLGEQTDNTNPTYNWVQNVSSSGTWYNANKQDFANMSDSEIPNGWVIKSLIPVTEENIEDYFTVTNNQYDDEYVSFDIIRESGALISAIPHFVLQLLDKVYDDNLYNLLYTTDDKVWHKWSDHYVGDIIQINPGEHIRIKNTFTSFDNWVVKPDFSKLLKIYDTLDSGSKYSIGGNLLTLFVGDNYKSPDLTNFVFYYLFEDLKGLQLDNSFTLGKIKNKIFRGMFSGCTNITNIPANIFSEVTFTENSCDGMFSGCTSITNIPENLFGTLNLPNLCCRSMFQGCTSITNIPENLFRNVLLSESSLVQMFQRCIHITNIPVNLFDALIIPKNCCPSMFRDCLGITEIHNILNNIQELGEGCFDNMFSGCRNIKKVTLSTSLDIPDGCFNSMFYGCKNINHISYGCKKLGIDVSFNWVLGVQTTDGIWENLDGYNYTEYSDSAIPEKWYKGIDVDNYQPTDRTYLNNCFQFKNVVQSGSNSFTITVNPDPGNESFPYSLYICTDGTDYYHPKFTRMNKKTIHVTLAKNGTCYIMRKCTAGMKSISPISIQIDGEVNDLVFTTCYLKGNVSSLYYGSWGMDLTPRNIYIDDAQSQDVVYLGLYKHIKCPINTKNLVN